MCLFIQIWLYYFVFCWIETGAVPPLVLISIILFVLFLLVTIDVSFDS